MKKYVKNFGYLDFLAARRFDLVKKKLQFKSGERVLDIGCGKAIYATMLDTYDLHYIGIEPDESSVLWPKIGWAVENQGSLIS